MTDMPQESKQTPQPAQPPKGRRTWVFISILALTTIAAALVTALLVNIFQRKQEARNLWVRKVEVNNSTTDPQWWGVNWKYEYDGYQRTAAQSRTNFGGGDATPAEKAERAPWLTRMFAGYAFSLDYRDRRGHAYMLLDQEKTRRVTERPQPGACLHCHASAIPTYRRLGSGNSDWDKVQDGFKKLSAMPYQAGLAEVNKTGSENPTGRFDKDGKAEFVHADGAHPVSCVDCHDPDTMDLRVTRPGFILGIKLLKEHQGVKDYDPNRDATRQEMRSYVCAQCHVEYYCGPKVTLLFPWGNGLKVEEIEAYYDNYKFPDGHRFYDWAHAETGAELLKAQHPEFEMWNQGVHARSGVACADCHMPYERMGATKVSDHWVRSPLLNVNRACQTCHHYDEAEIRSRVGQIQDRHFKLMQEAGAALIDMLDAIKPLRAPFNEANRAAAEGKAKDKLAADAAYAKLAAADQAKKLAETTQATLNEMWAAQVAGDPALTAIAELQRKAQWRLDFVAAENSMGFHAPQEAARILGESIDLSRQAQIKAMEMGRMMPTTRPK
jgi:nitrite reductase (cytochrome c-552)